MTPQGRQRCAEARLVHGNETTVMRRQRSEECARLAVLEWAARAVGLIDVQCPQTRGAKPKRMDTVEQVLCAVVSILIASKDVLKS